MITLSRHAQGFYHACLFLVLTPLNTLKRLLQRSIAFPPLKGSAIATGDQAAHIDVVLNGKPGTYMAAFGPQLSEVDIAAIITYERNAWGNDTGEFIQPIEIANIKAAQ